MNNFEKFLSNKQSDIADHLYTLYNNFNEIINKKNLKIKFLSENYNELSEKTKNIKQPNKIIIFNNSSFFLKQKKINLKLLKNNLTKEIKNKRNNEKNYIKNDQLEAFKIVINDIENKKDIIKKQNEQINKLDIEKIELQNKLDEQLLIIDNYDEEKENLINDKKTVISENIILKNQLNEKEFIIENLNNFKEDYIKLNNELSEINNNNFQLKTKLEQKDKLINIQINTIDSMKKEINKHNLDIVDLKNNFLELLDDFNDIFKMVEQNE